MGLAGAALTASKTVLLRFLNDKALRELVTYRKWTGQAYSEALGHVVDTYSSFTNLRSIRIAANANLTIIDQTALEAGDVLFVMYEADAPEGISLKDQIRDAISRTYKVKGIHHVFDVAVVFHVEGHPR